MRQALVISFLAGLLLQAGCSIEGKNTAQEAQPPTAASASPDGNNVEPSGDAATPTADNSEGQPPTSDAESSFEKGMQAYRQDRNEEAVEAFQEAARLKPDYADAYLRLAYAHAALGQREESTKAFQQAAKAYERLTRSKLKDAGIYFNMGTPTPNSVNGMMPLKRSSKPLSCSLTKAKIITSWASHTPSLRNTKRRSRN